MAITSQEIKQIMKQVLAEEAKENEVDIQPIIIPPLTEQSTQINSSVLTQDVVDSFIRHKEYKGLKEGSIKTYRKRLGILVKQHRLLPLDTKTIMNYLEQFKGGTRRYKLNHHDLLNMLYEHAMQFFEIPRNPLGSLERPTITHQPIRTLSLEEVCQVDAVICPITERVIWELTVGHGWRQIEVRRITAGDVRAIRDGVIWCRGKEREEFTPVLPETQLLLEQLADGLDDGECVIRSIRMRAGKTQPLGESGMRQWIQRMINRSGKKYQGHDLRRTFCTLVEEASGSESLAMRLARDKITGVNDRYINATPAKLRESLLKYSPIRLIRHKQAGENLVEAGESRTPRPREATQDMLQA